MPKSREELIRKATEIHDQKGCHCDRKYLMSCPNLANAILQLGNRKEPENDAPSSD
jgi:hypothetical protein